MKVNAKNENNEFTKQILGNPFFYFTVFGSFALREILNIWLPRNLTFFVVIFSLASFMFFNLESESWFHKKHGNGLKGLILYNLAVGIIAFCIMSLIRMVFDYFPLIFASEVVFVFVLINFFIMVGVAFYFIAKPSKK